jgi:Transposase, Mutator family
MTGIGPVGVRQPRVRDRGAADDAGRIRFTPAILPPYARRSRSLEVLIPILYLKGISTGDFEEALAALLGKDAPGLSASRGKRDALSVDAGDTLTLRRGMVGEPRARITRSSR